MLPLAERFAVPVSSSIESSLAFLAPVCGRLPVEVDGWLPEVEGEPLEARPVPWTAWFIPARSPSF